MKHVFLGGLDVSRIGLGAMTMAGTYTSGGASMTPSPSAPSAARWTWASPTSTPPRSTARSTARN
jgi:aryl-alcohol dehydrogenase-like predicted oxidoreductase